MDPEKATELLVEWQQWWAKIALRGYIDQREVVEQLENRKAFLQGPTKDGHPLLIIQTYKHSPAKDILQQDCSSSSLPRTSATVLRLRAPENSTHPYFSSRISNT